MKKAILVISSALLLTGTAFTQMPKFGYVNSLEIAAAMPDTKVIQAQLDSFQLKLQEEYNTELKKYEKLEKELNDLIAKQSSETIIALKKDEVSRQAQLLQELPGLYQQEMVEKEQKLSFPLLQKIENAIKEVAKEKGLLYVFDTSKGVLLYVNENDNITVDVRGKLGIK